MFLIWAIAQGIVLSRDIENEGAMNIKIYTTCIALLIASGACCAETASTTQVDKAKNPQPDFVVTFDYSSSHLPNQKGVLKAATNLDDKNVLLVSHTRGAKDSGELKLASDRLSAVSDVLYMKGFAKQSIQTLNDWTPYPSHSIESRQIDVYAVNDFNKITVADVTGIRLEHLSPVTAKKTVTSNSRHNIWTMKRGELLSTGLQRWAKLAGWELVWNVGVDYPIARDIKIQDGFVNASEKLLDAYAHMQTPVVFEPIFYTKNKVLSVSLGE